jgi:hypothetical protein
MDLIEPVSFSFGLFVGIVACYSVSDLVFSKDTNNEACDEN